MTSPIDPPRRVTPDRRSRDRRTVDRRGVAPAEAPSAPSQLPAIVPGSVSAPPAPEPPPVGDAAFAAQLLGQGGQKRGLRGGTVVLEQARSAYLEAEWSGPTDRRKPAGRNTKTEL